MNGPEQYDRPLAVADGVYWVGFHEEQTNFHCNPYLVLAGDAAVLIDGGSRPDFAVVMMKISRGYRPVPVAALIYQHYDRTCAPPFQHRRDDRLRQSEISPIPGHSSSN
jgi:hypothetical protein